MQTQFDLIKDIRSSKGRTFISLVEGGIVSVKEQSLAKRGISLKDNVYVFPESTLVKTEHYQAGDYIFAGDHIAPADGPNGEEGKPIYLEGEMPKYTQPSVRFREFISLAQYKALRELEMLKAAM
jgi:hypothetical protein